jgi:GTP cyclohydrolase II
VEGKCFILRQERLRPVPKDRRLEIMSIQFTPLERLARARADLRMGAFIIVSGGDADAVVLAAETATAERLADIRSLGETDLVLTARRAETLKARAYDGDLARVRLPRDADLAWVRASADPSADLLYPFKGPYQTRRGGSTELHRAAIALGKQAHLLPAALVAPVPRDVADELSAGAGLSRTPVTDLPLDPRDAAMTEIASARVPLEVSEAGRVRVFRPLDGAEEHYAVEIGRPDRHEPVLSRLHSACFTGDLIGSLKCDCGFQLKAALSQIGAAGAGVLLYLNQEGRGIGLANKMRAYSLQDQGFDTVEANHRLGFEDDERDFRIGANILREMGFSRVRLMTNNPAKVAMMQTCGLEVVERVPVSVGRGLHNASYLDTKAKKSGHLL